MEILAELEKEGRGPYTGSFGYVTHSGNMDINILIRTILKESNDLSLELEEESLQIQFHKTKHLKQKQKPMVC